MEKLFEQSEIYIEHVEGDTLTPISIFQRITGKKKFLLESSLKNVHSGRYSFIGTDPVLELRGLGDINIITRKNGEESITGNTLDVLKGLLPNLDQYRGNIPFIGGAVGYVGYDAIRQYENIGPTPKDEVNMPDIHLLFYEQVIIYDHVDQKVCLAATPLLKETTTQDLLEMINKRKQELQSDSTSENQEKVSLSSFQANTSKEEFIQNVKIAKEYISNGDIFQVVLSQRMKATISGDPFSLYRKLRITNPSPYMYFLDFGEYIVTGSSPESLVRANTSAVTTNPIAGTRPRGKSVFEDEELELDLRSDEKELAEHKMLVDLGRNDLGKICKFGSVKVHKYIEVEKYKHVMHLVSEVSGELAKDKTAADALVSCLPAGTVSGAPKIRAMEIINELEPVKRGVYSGAVGYFSTTGTMDFALAIRTMVIKEQTAYIQAGAGIVYDSIPEKEYEETIHKLKTFLEE